MSRIHNFSAGPGVLPEPVLEEAQQALWDFAGSGMGITECSHRSPMFGEVIDSARARLKRLLTLDDDQEVLFLHGGARTQFFMIPMNLLRGRRATYLDTGTWAHGAAGDAEQFGTVDVPFSSRDSQYDHVPELDRLWSVPDHTTYLHYTSNNTVAGTEYHGIPKSTAPLVCDMSSDILSRPIDGSKFGLIYAGAQKNMGPSGVTTVIFRKSWLDRCDPDLPAMLRYRTHLDKGSMHNTPCTFAIYMVERVAAWVEANGGTEGMDTRNARQAGALYSVIDGSDFWAGKTVLGSRSRMNVTFTTGDDALDLRFHTLAAEQGLAGLKGHRSVGGLRASIYNAQTDVAIDALVSFMTDFEDQHG